MSQVRDRALAIGETTIVKELLLAHPEALRVLLDRQVPVTCANGTVADAARASGLSAAVLVTEIWAAIVRHE